jgi:hypothetical protein
VGRAILLWLLGVPIPIIILLALFWRVRNRRSLTEAVRHRTVVTARPRQRNPNDAVYCMPSDETVTFTVPSASAMTRSALSS